MTLVILAVAALFAIAYPQTSVVHPAAVTLRHGLQNESLQCEPMPEEAPSLDQAPIGRAATFSQRGAYQCRRFVFTSAERNPWIERVLAAETLKAKTLAAEVAGRKREFKGVLGVSVRGEADRQLLARVATIYRVEFANVLGRERVRHFDQDPPEAPYLDVEIRKVDTPESISSVRWVTGRGEMR